MDSENHSNVSDINEKFLSSSTSGDDDDPLKIFRPSKDSYRTIVENIVDNIYEQERGIHEVSLSYCSSPRETNSKYSFDHRLKYWNSVLEDRKNLAMKLQKKTGKAVGEMLFNYPVTVKERDKSNLKRFLDYADRMDPDALRNRKPLTINRKCCWYCEVDGVKCKHLTDLTETLPKAERDGQTDVEIINLPKITQQEILGEKGSRRDERRSNWFTTKAMQRGFAKKHVKLQRVLDFYPDIDNLQVIGKSLITTKSIQHDSDIEFVGNEIIQKISSDSLICDMDSQTGIEKVCCEVVAELCPYALLVNGYLLTTSAKQSPLLLNFETRFKCQAYQRVVKRVMHLKNVGQKVINFIWTKCLYYKRRKHLLNSSDDEFYFDKRTFRLIPDEEHEILIEYLPRRYGITKYKWFLRILPTFFCRKVGRVIIKLKGICRPYQEYLNKLNSYEQTTTFKSKKIVMHTLTKAIAEMTPLLKQSEDLCPYKRQLDERELFEALNKGYTCERYHDLDLLKEIYGRIKVPREPAWDFKISTLKNKIFALATTEERAITFNEMNYILNAMKGVPITWEKKICDTSERDRARFIYVRGVICSGIDDWEEIAYALEDTFYKTAIREYLEALFNAAEEEELENAEEEENEKIEEFHEKSPEEIREEIWKNLRYNKSFHDALYIDSYTHLCNVIEDIVSVIESTDII